MKHGLDWVPFLTPSVGQSCRDHHPHRYMQTVTTKPKLYCLSLGWVAFFFSIKTPVFYQSHWSPLKMFQFSSVQSLSRVRLFATPWTAACQASLSVTNSQSLPKPTSVESVMPSNHLTSVVPFSSCLQSFPASGSFQMSQLFASGGQSTGVSASASVLPVNTQDWSPLGCHLPRPSAQPVQPLPPEAAAPLL